MRWKDAETGEGKEAENNDPYYEDDGYESFKNDSSKKKTILSGNPVRYLYWGLGIALVAGVVLLVMLLFSNINESADLARIKKLENEVRQLEQQLEKYDGIDEKVTRIWEQAKSFENFKTRFDRSEASMSLRMDHLAMSLDALQKKTDETLAKVAALEKQPPPKKASVPPAAPKKAAAGIHTVAAGDTLYSISKKHDLSVKELKALNKLPEDAVIHVGQKLAVSAP
jgi:LysM repeat protein